MATNLRAIARAQHLAVAVSAACAASSTLVGQTPAQLDSAFTALTDAAGIVGMSAATIRDGKVEWSASYGVRHSAQRERVDQRTVFAAAGLTEPVVAYAVLRLADRGVIDLDRPLAELAPLRSSPIDPRHARMTPRMVLTHSTGLVDGGRDSTRVAFDPGTNWNQSTKAFGWLGDVVARATGLTITEVARREVFEPLGMERSYLVTPDAVAARDSAESNGTMSHEEWGRPQAFFRAAIAAPAAATGLRTTADDYAKFVIAVMDGRGLAAETARRMLTAQVDARNAVDYTSRAAEVRERIAWGLGWGIERRDDGELAWHWGDGGYDKSFVMMHPATRRAVVYLTNSQTGLSIMGAVVSLVFPGPDYAVRWLEYWPYDLPTTMTRRALVREGRRGGVAGVAREYALRRARRDSTLMPDLMRSTAVALGVLGSPEAGDTLLALVERDHPDSLVASIARGDLALVELRDAARAARHYSRATRVAPNDSVARARARWAQARAELRRDAVALPPATLARYAGEYGQLRVSLENGRLHYHEESGVRFRLIVLADGSFAPDGMPNVRMRFEGGEPGPARSLVRLYWDGDRFEDARTR